MASGYTCQRGEDSEYVDGEQRREQTARLTVQPLHTY